MTVALVLTAALAAGLSWTDNVGHVHVYSWSDNASLGIGVNWFDGCNQRVSLLSLRRHPYFGVEWHENSTEVYCPRHSRTL
ncbi:MAG TPA: hypothetical protein VF160_08300 [Candidatus Dormibacteraeota bacterium]